MSNTNLDKAFDKLEKALIRRLMIGTLIIPIGSILILLVVGITFLLMLKGR